MKKVLIATGIAALAFASVVGAQGYVFSTNLTVGSTGADVTALQTWLIANNFSIPAISSGAAAKGYFGSQTKTAVQAYQTSKSIPSTGFVGPLTRAALNGTASTGGTSTIVCPVGYVCNPVGGTTPTPSVNPGTITTPGVEGTLSATQSNSGLVSTAYEGDKMAGILGVQLEAKNSDISVQRVKLNLGTNTKIYNKIYTKLYVTDGTNVLASTDLNSSTVIKDGSNYYITIAGFNYVVPKNTKKNLVIKADVMGSIDSGDQASYTVTFASQGIRGVDGAGIDQYAGDTSITRSVTIDGSLSESANLTLSLASNTPKKADVVATGGSDNNELDKLTLLAFNLRAEKDRVQVTDLNIAVSKGGTGAATASSSTIYLYDGNTEIDNATVNSGGVATFSDVDLFIDKDTTKTFWVKMDVRSADTNRSNFIASATSTGITAENSTGDSVTGANLSGSATGYQIGVSKEGAEIVLLSKSVAVTGTNNSGSTLSTSTVTATFDLAITAKGGDILMGQAGSTTPAFTFGIYTSGGTTAVSTSTTDVAASGIQVTSISTPMPDGVTQDAVNKSFTITKNNTSNMRVTVSFAGKNTIGSVLTDTYSVGLRQVAYIVDGTAATNTFMAGETAWATDYVKP